MFVWIFGFAAGAAMAQYDRDETSVYTLHAKRFFFNADGRVKQKKTNDGENVF